MEFNFYGYYYKYSHLKEDFDKIERLGSYISNFELWVDKQFLVDLSREIIFAYWDLIREEIKNPGWNCSLDKLGNIKPRKS